jgi:hypothetical protein
MRAEPAASAGPVPPAAPSAQGRTRRRAILVAASIAAALVVATAALAPLLRNDQARPDATTAQPAPTTEPPATQDPEPEPTPTAALSLGEAMSHLEGVVDEGQQAGAIRRDTAVDLRNLLRELHRTQAREDQVTMLREKVAVRADEGAISRPYAERLDLALAGLPG